MAKFSGLNEIYAISASAVRHRGTGGELMLLSLHQPTRVLHVQGAAARALDLIDGRRSLAQILERVPQARPSELRELVRYLIRNQLLERRPQRGTRPSK